MASDQDDEFRREAMQMALTSGLSRQQVASELGVGVSTQNTWIRALGDTAHQPDKRLSRENERLRREVRLLKEERELLKKAVHYFAGPHP